MPETRILIVDDDDQNLYMLQALLEGHGYSTVQAKNGEEALEQALNDPPDLIITDILMPVMDGFALCRRWKAEDRLKPIPFVFYTATYTDRKDEEFALKLGADKFICKPADPDDMIAIIKEILEQRQSQSQVTTAAEKPEEEELLRLYSERLITKLESKMLALQQEVEERNKAEEALSASEAKYRTYVENAPYGILVTNSKGEFIDANEVACRILGFEKQDLIGKSGIEIISEETLPEALEQFGILRVNGSVQAESTLNAKDGSKIHISLKAVVLSEDRHMLFFSDITEFKQTQKEKALLEEQFRQSQKMEAIGRLAGGVAHDFNNLLTVIHGFSDLILNKLDLSSPFRPEIAEIKKASDSAGFLTNQLLAFSRKQIVSPKVMNLNDAVARSQKMLRRVIGEDIDLIVSPDVNLHMVTLDPGQVDQVLLNLAVNARDAMPEGGLLAIETRNVLLDGEVSKIDKESISGDFVLLSFSDNGMGMSPELLKQIFEPFFTTKELGKGTGLGLSTIYGIVKQNRGYIDVESEPGKGSIFKMYFPSVYAEAESLSSVDGQAEPSGQETILLVEDLDSLRRLVVTALDSLGYKIIEAASGPEALEFAAGCKPGEIDLLLTDVIMPVMSGRQLYDQLVEANSSLKVLYMSGYPNEAIARHGILEDGIHFIQKPFRLDNLARTVRKVLDS